MGLVGAAIAGGLGLLGGAAGSEPDKQTSTIDVSERVIVDPESDEEKRFRAQVDAAFGQLTRGISGGAGAADVALGTQTQRDFAARLQRAATGQFTPEELARSKQFTEDIFAPQQAALDQQFIEEQQQTARLAAQLGRSQDDPVLRNLLFKSKLQQQGQLEAQKTAFRAQVPERELGFASQAAQLRSNLATQALANRQALLSLGSQLQGQERQFRLATGRQRREGTDITTSGGGMKGAISGFIGGLGAGAQLAGSFGGFSGFGGGGGGGGLTTSGTPGETGFRNFDASRLA